MMLMAMAASAAATAMMNRVKIWPVAGSGATKRLKAMRLVEAAASTNSAEMSMPITVRRTSRP